jgi:hypothetical protein
MVIYEHHHQFRMIIFLLSSESLIKFSLLVTLNLGVPSLCVIKFILLATILVTVPLSMTSFLTLILTSFLI